MTDEFSPPNLLPSVGVILFQTQTQRHKRVIDVGKQHQTKHHKRQPQHRPIDAEQNAKRAFHPFFDAPPFGLGNVQKTQRVICHFTQTGQDTTVPKTTRVHGHRVRANADAMVQQHGKGTFAKPIFPEFGNCSTQTVTDVQTKEHPQLLVIQGHAVAFVVDLLQCVAVERFVHGLHGVVQHDCDFRQCQNARTKVQFVFDTIGQEPIDDDQSGDAFHQTNEGDEHAHLGEVGVGFGEGEIHDCLLELARPPGQLGSIWVWGGVKPKGQEAPNPKVNPFPPDTSANRF